MSQFDVPEGCHDLLVGGGPLKWWDDPKDCVHTAGKLCQLCVGLTDAEAMAIREYFQQLNAERDT